MRRIAFLASAQCGILALGLLGAVDGAGAAETKVQQCSVAAPASTREHWSFRLVDGRRCWYQGANGFAKSKLRWADRPHDEQPAAANAPQSDCCAAKSLGNFEARWRALDANARQD